MSLCVCKKHLQRKEHERVSKFGYRHVEMKLASVCVCLLMRKPECVSRKEGICIALNELEICVRRILSG